ncbi:glucose 1-dehydrogenase [Flagellimonas zhangzhouensis]|uniref:NAD(P)-dependent dehydrogenase, short-chain alcohol dehydrogenase family n=1 Tax=Flagellimonas zhangzhouensis TaxID=1073328 RepID=A0A1H2U4Q3_9FLAO|nr:glucose 1-dehydrogenase [Allomuricauda zhangzhouensis]SDQ20338.1 NAD(P)-dependent dehydrogenase, short-chain alcohol dehydrogenase family [Allomuricauda zhangzhouensis]SDW51050.1 NAD(P)-dependent dehydrogenase, short-chain alcohol dehydrogenase family [Allomuricauda zhangzhouensis]
MNKLEGKVAIVTGATSGMGLETAKKYLQEGAKVVLTGRNQEKLDALKGELQGDYLLVKAEASSSKDSAALISKTVEAFGQIDIIFLNAGILRLEPIEALTETIFDEVYDVNVKGPLFTVKEAYNFLNEGASIIFNTSVVNVKGFPGLAAYASSKAALRSLVRTLATEFGPKGIRVNAIAPGPIDTPIYDKHNMPKESFDEMAESFPSMVSLGRYGNSGEIASTALFLASSDSSFITGAEIPVDGGLAQV